MKFTMTSNIFKISTNGDLNITVNEYKVSSSETSKSVKKLAGTAVFEVERSKLEKSESEPFRAMLGGRWSEVTSKAITFEEDHIEAMKILFHSLHGTLEQVALDTVKMETVWCLILACDKYDIKFKTASWMDWFAKWYEMEAERDDDRKGYNFQRMAMFPCYVFDYAEGFQKCTRLLVYGSKGHISEKNPTSELKLHMPPRIIRE